MANMRVVRFYPPGGPEKLQLATEPVPSQLGHGEMLIKVHGVGVIWPELTWPIYQNPDGSYLNHIPGHDFSGIVTKVGPGFEGSDIEPGSEVYAFTSIRNHEGGMAEYTIADLQSTVPKPQNLTFPEAATVPLSALTAWQALFDHAHLQKGQKLLVTAAAGGTGMFAVQLGKMVGAHVIGTASDPRSLEMLQEFGVDQIIDYKKVDPTHAVQDVDVVLNCVAGTFNQCLKLVKKTGIIIDISEYRAEELAREQGLQAKFFIVSVNVAQLREITKLLEQGTLKTVVDSVFPMEKVRDAFEHGMKGHVHGKIVVSIAA